MQPQKTATIARPVKAMLELLPGCVVPLEEQILIVIFAVQQTNGLINHLMVSVKPVKAMLELLQGCVVPLEEQILIVLFAVQETNGLINFLVVSVNSEWVPKPYF
jgi:hypothetical protein